jgi:hypothetical protein
VNQKRLIVGVVIFIALVLCVCASVSIGVQWWRKGHQPSNSKRMLILNLPYCGTNGDKPCIESFSVDADGKMLVSLLTPTSTYPDFYLTIGNGTITNKYECQKVEDFPTHIYCTGAEMYPGEALQFTLISMADETVLAEGRFAIIGLLLPNPQEEGTATLLFTEAPAATEAPTDTPTPILIEIFTPTPDVTSYPNPTSYP